MTLPGVAGAAGRRVLVTGIGSGLGKAIALRLARAGDQVVGTVIDLARARAFALEAREAGLAIDCRALELSDHAQIDELASWLESSGGVDVVIHNAGFGVFGPVEEVDAEATQRQFAVNLFGPLHLTRRLLPGLRSRKGRIIWVGSLAGRLALPFQAHYSATKAATASVCDALRMEVGPFGVPVTCVEPGDFATGFTRARQERAAAASFYEGRLRACREQVESMERGGADPELVARVVEEVSRQRRPPARRPVGRWARAICLLQRLLPDRLREVFIRSTYRV